MYSDIERDEKLVACITMVIYVAEKQVCGGGEIFEMLRFNIESKTDGKTEKINVINFVIKRKKSGKKRVMVDFGRDFMDLSFFSLSIFLFRGLCVFKS